MDVVDFAGIRLELGLGKVLGEGIAGVGKAVDLEREHDSVGRGELTAEASAAGKVGDALDNVASDAMRRQLHCAPRPGTGAVPWTPKVRGSNLPDSSGGTDRSSRHRRGSTPTSGETAE